MHANKPNRRKSAEAAETLAIRAVAYLAAEDDRIATFMGATGCTPTDLPGLIKSPSFLASVLDFIMSDEGLAAAFSVSEGLPPGALAAARADLPGGDLPNWT